MNQGKMWLAPLTGVLFVIVAVIGFTLAGEPPNPADDSVEEVVDFYVDNNDSVFAGSVLEAIAAALFIFFGGYLFRTLRASGAEASAVITLAGTIVFGLGMALDGTINIALAEAADSDQVEPATVQALSFLWENDFLPFALGLLVFLIGFGVAIVRHGVLPAWIGWAAIVAALTAVSPAFFVAAIATGLLVIASSVIFARRERSPQAV